MSLQTSCEITDPSKSKPYSFDQKNLADAYTLNNINQYKKEQGEIIPDNIFKRLNDRISGNEQTLIENLKQLGLPKFSANEYHGLKLLLVTYKDVYEHSDSNNINDAAKRYGCAQAMMFVMRTVGYVEGRQTFGGASKKTRKTKRSSKKSKKSRSRS